MYKMLHPTYPPYNQQLAAIENIGENHDVVLPARVGSDFKRHGSTTGA